MILLMNWLSVNRQIFANGIAISTLNFLSPSQPGLIVLILANNPMRPDKYEPQAAFEESKLNPIKYQKQMFCGLNKEC